MSILPPTPDSKTDRPRGWLREEFRRAAERRNALPAYARPIITRPWFPKPPRRVGR